MKTCSSQTVLDWASSSSKRHYLKQGLVFMSPSEKRCYRNEGCSHWHTREISYWGSRIRGFQVSQKFESQIQKFDNCTFWGWKIRYFTGQALEDCQFWEFRKLGSRISYFEDLKVRQSKNRGLEHVSSLKYSKISGSTSNSTVLSFSNREFKD